MVPIEVTVIAKASTTTRDEVESRLLLEPGELTNANNYRTTFDGIWIDFDGQGKCLVIKESGRLVKADLAELIVKTIPAPTAAAV